MGERGGDPFEEEHAAFAGDKRLGLRDLLDLRHGLANARDCGPRLPAECVTPEARFERPRVRRRLLRSRTRRAPVRSHRVVRAALVTLAAPSGCHQRYGAESNRAGTYLATFRAVAKKYPTKSARDVLDRLVAATPGDEGKWFAAAKDAGLFDEAIALARRTPCDPRTLARAARDHVDTQAPFAIEAGVTALDWLGQGYGYEVTGADVWAAYVPAKQAAERLGSVAGLRARVRAIAALYSKGDNLVARVLRTELHDA